MTTWMRKYLDTQPQAWGKYQERCKMTDAVRSARQWLARCADEQYAYLTTIGRRSGKAHRIEIWFGAQDGRLYLLAGGRERSDWVKNLQARAQLTVELGDETHTGMARVLQEGTGEDRLARELLVTKYRDGDNLNEWGRTALPIVIEFPADGEPSPDTGASIGK
jgi:deazaflavin-dependent oxidoreductase (nitroreductase family)